MKLTQIQTVLKIIETILAFSGINIFVEFRDLNIFSKIYRLFSAFMIICVYTAGFYYDFWLNLNDTTTENIGLTFFLANAVVGITSTVGRAILLVINRRKLLFIMNWLRELYQSRGIQDDSTSEKLMKTGDRVLKLWK